MHLAAALDELTAYESLASGVANLLEHLPGLLLPHDRDHPHAHVEGGEEFRLVRPAFPRDDVELVRARPTAGTHHRIETPADDPVDVPGDSASRDVGERPHATRLEAALEDRQVASVRTQEDVRHGAPGPREGVVDPEFEAVEEEGAHEAVAVRVDAARGESDETVPRLRISTGQLRVGDLAHHEPREVVFPRRVEIGHLRGLSPEQRTAVRATGGGEARDHARHGVRVKHAAGDVVHEDERPGAFDEDVVDAVVHEIGAHRVVPVGHEGDLELRPHAIGARHEFPARRRPEPSSERAEVRTHGIRAGPVDEPGEPGLRRASRLEVHARVPVRQSVVHVSFMLPPAGLEHRIS